MTFALLKHDSKISFCSGQPGDVSSLHHSILVRIERPVVARIDDLFIRVSVLRTWHQLLVRTFAVRDS